MTTDSLARPSPTKSSLPNSQSSWSCETWGQQSLLCIDHLRNILLPRLDIIAALCFLPQSSEFLVRPVTSLWIPRSFCVPYIWQLISNELFSAHKKSSYRTKSGCFIDSRLDAVWPPSSIHYPQVFYPNVTPLCLSYSSNKGSKLQEQKNYWQSVKWSLSRTDAPHSWARLEAWCPLIMACPVHGSYWVLFAPPRCSSVSDEFHWPGWCLWRPECLDPSPAPDLIIFTPARVMFGVRTAWEWGENTQSAPSAVEHNTQNRRIWLNHEFTFTVMDTDLLAQGTHGLGWLTQ